MRCVRDGRAHARLPVRLSATASYISPTGRWCRWWPAQGRTKNIDGEVFLYHLPDGSAAPRLPGSAGFFMSEANLHLLQRVGG